MKIDYLIVAPEFDFDEATRFRTGPLAQGLLDRGHSVAFVTRSKASSPIDGATVLHLDYSYRVAEGERWNPATAHRYDVTDFQDYAYCEHLYGTFEVRPKSYEQLVLEVPAAFCCIQQLFDEHDIRHVIHAYLGGEIMRRVVSRIAQSKGIPTVYESGTRYFDDRVLFVLDDQGTIPARPTVRFSDLSDDKQKYLRGYLEHKRSERPTVQYFQGNERDFWPLLMGFIRNSKWKDSKRLLRGFRTATVFAQYELSKLLWENANTREDYVYFPLHFPIESNIVLRTPTLLQQDAVCKIISNALPENVLLYVKQHPTNPAEGIPYKAIRRITKMENARLIRATTNSWDLAAHAKAVCTLYGTVGFENVLLGRPTVVLGEPPYKGWGVTHDVADLSEVGAAITAALAAPSISDERILDFLASFESIHVSGDWYASPLDPDVLASGVLDFCSRLVP